MEAEFIIEFMQTLKAKTHWQYSLNKVMNSPLLHSQDPPDTDLAALWNALRIIEVKLQKVQ
jgi:hypothetical protein